MRYAQVTLVVELSEDFRLHELFIDTAEKEGKLMDDINDALVNQSEYVTALRSIEIKDVTALCEEE